MRLFKLATKKELISSQDQEEVFNNKFQIHNFTFIPDQLPAFIELQREFQEIIATQIDGIKKGLINYNSKEGLKLYAYKENNLIIVISGGEVGRGLYKIFLEGIWEINET